jgi:hypothetical protein
VLDAAERMEMQIASMQEQVARFVRDISGAAAEPAVSEDPHVQTVPFLREAG